MSSVLTALISGRRIEVRGIVQGVGFRPQVCAWRRTAGVIGGRVATSRHGGGHRRLRPRPALRDFEAGRRACAAAACASIARRRAAGRRAARSRPTDFDIDGSAAAMPGLGVAPDWVICPACVAETLDPFARRYRYPFTACTDCGPRLSVFQRAPYDRAHTTMAPFPLCADCRARVRRPGRPPLPRPGHGLPRLRPAGPRCSGSTAAPLALGRIDFARRRRRRRRPCSARGEILLVKGLGGYQLACDATDADCGDTGCAR